MNKIILKFDGATCPQFIVLESDQWEHIEAIRLMDYEEALDYLRNINIEPPVWDRPTDIPPFVF